MRKDDYMTTKEAGEALGVSDSRVRQLRIEGVLKGVQFGHVWMITPESVEEAKKRSGRWRHRS